MHLRISNNPFHSGYLQTFTLTHIENPEADLLYSMISSCENPNEMPHNAAFNQCLHCLQSQKQIFIT